MFYESGNRSAFSLRACVLVLRDGGIEHNLQNNEDMYCLIVAHSDGTELVVFPEFDLITETEQYSEEEEERSEEARIRDYEQFLATSQVCKGFLCIMEKIMMELDRCAAFIP